MEYNCSPPSEIAHNLTPPITDRQFHTISSFNAASPRCMCPPTPFIQICNLQHASLCVPIASIQRIETSVRHQWIRPPLPSTITCSTTSSTASFSHNSRPWPTMHPLCSSRRALSLQPMQHNKHSQDTQDNQGRADRTTIPLPRHPRNICSRWTSWCR